MHGQVGKAYSDEEVCSGTWIPKWTAAFGEMVHMYEVTPVQPQWDESWPAAQFPGTVFDALDDIRGMEQTAEKTSPGCLSPLRTAALTTNQDWYLEFVNRPKRGAGGEGQAEKVAGELGGVDPHEASPDFPSYHTNSTGSPAGAGGTDDVSTGVQTGPRPKRVCTEKQEAAALSAWRADVTSKYTEVGAGILRIMCIVEYCSPDMDMSVADAVKADLAEDVKFILHARMQQLMAQEYNIDGKAHGYDTMLKWLHETQSKDAGTSPASAAELAENRNLQAGRDKKVMEAVAALMNGRKDTELVTALRAELERYKGNMQRCVSSCDWAEFFGITNKERTNCCVCGGPAHNPESGYCRSKPLRFIKECLSGLLGTPEGSVLQSSMMATAGSDSTRNELELDMTTSNFNVEAWEALADAGYEEGNNVLPLYTACAWGVTGETIRAWEVSHVYKSQEYGFLAQMKSTEHQEVPAGNVNIATEDMYMVREVRVTDETEMPFGFPITHDLSNESWITRVTQKVERISKDKVREESIHREHLADPSRTFNIGQTAMLTLQKMPEAGKVQSTSYGGTGANAAEGMNHKNAVINVGELKDADIELDVERMINTLTSELRKSPHTGYRYFDVNAPLISHSVEI